MTRDEVNALGAKLISLLNVGEGSIIVAITAHSPSPDCRRGSVSATVKNAFDTATSEAVGLYDAILLARGKLVDMAAARKAAEDGLPRKGGRPRKAISEIAA